MVASLLSVWLWLKVDSPQVLPRAKKVVFCNRLCVSLCMFYGRLRVPEVWVYVCTSASAYECVSQECGERSLIQVGWGFPHPGSLTSSVIFWWRCASVTFFLTLTCQANARDGFLPRGYVATARLVNVLFFFSNPVVPIGTKIGMKIVITCFILF